MNYFEIINAVLIELNYSPVASFVDLTKLEHKRLMNVINRLNKEICGMNEDFYFRQVTKNCNLHHSKIEYNIDIQGKLAKVIGSQGEYLYEPDYGKFYSKNPPQKSYSIYGEKILFSPSDDVLKIFYSTDLFVKRSNQVFVSDFEREDDKSIIPDNFAEKLFINGAAFNFKQNAAHPKYAHWKQEYDKALAELLASAKRISGSGIILDGGYRKL